VRWPIVDEPWPLIGRDRELELGASGISDAGAPGVVIMGPAGVGRTRLGDELATRSAAPVIYVPATRSAASIPFGAFAPFLPRDGLGDGDTYVRLRRAEDAILDSVPEGARPVVYVDDAHLLDDASAALLMQLSISGRVALLLSVRTGEPQPDALVDLWKDSLSRLDLEPLDRAAHDALLAAILGGPVEARTAHSIHRATGANPLIVREFVTGLQRAGSLVQQSGLWVASGALGVPPRLGELLEMRLQTLSPSARDAFDLIALGEPVAPGLVDRLGMSDALVELQRADLVRVVSSELRREIRLTHPMHRHVAQGATATHRHVELLRALATWVRDHGTRRREDTRRLAQWAIDAGDRADPAVLLSAAEDAALGRNLELTARLARMAAHEGAGVRAVYLHGRALDGLGRHDDAEAVFAAAESGPMTTEERALLASARADNLFRGLGRGDDAAAVAATHSGRGDGSDEGDDDEPMAPLLAAQLAYFALFEVRLDEAMALASPHVDADDVAVRAMSLLTVAMVYQQRGESTAAVEVARRALAAQREAEGQLHVPEEATSATSLALSLAGLGQMAEALELIEPIYAHAVQQGSRHGQAWSARTLATLHLMAGRWSTAERYAREAGVVLDELAHPMAAPTIAMAAHAAAHGPDPAVAEDLLHDADAHPPTAVRMLDLDVERSRAWVEVSRQDVPGAVTRLVAAADAAQGEGRGAIEATLRHDLLRLGAIEYGAARTAELASSVDGPLMAARVRFSAGLVGRDGAVLDDAAGQFAALGLPLYAAEAANEAAIAHRSAGSPKPASASRRRGEAWAAECGSPRTPMLAHGTSTAVLTRREREIAGLAAAGRSTRDIAETLFVSPRTVDNHLQRVYGKLGISSRAELADALGDVER
jgi:DNA-binding CsgD family transcriptional regulator/tetratricopeptide (TPR) repeat protein